jgi:hypothetical protein
LSGKSIKLEDKIKLYEADGIVGAYYALNRKLNEITGAISRTAYLNQIL